MTSKMDADVNSQAVGDCPFCAPPADRILAENRRAVALLDAFPVSKGHTLVVPKRHVASLAEISRRERVAIWQLLDQAREELVLRFGPDGFNFGVNDGVAAGQTVMHLHVHLIPRYKGDQEDPRGGVRWIIPDRANYWDVR